MKKRKTPLRKCLGCSDMKDKRQLIRVVKDKLGNVSIDLKGKAPGRGAYICNKQKCFEVAYKSKAFNRAFKSEISPEVYEHLMEEIQKNAE
ncbi:YlxR family protein [Serpentinicella sp. ANB-PHB4]|nr:YlxR family protein [Serpentinicella sp. ANB-PHB4]MDR5658222.1 YlxR family protein [Serpentinicella sp. ANB-PHB4]